MSPERVRELVSSIHDGTIGEHELGGLETELLVNPQARELYLAYSEIESSLEWGLTSEQFVAPLLRLESINKAGRQSAHAEHMTGKICRARLSQRLVSRWVIAAAIMIAAGIGFLVAQRTLKQADYLVAGAPDIQISPVSVGLVEGLSTNCVWYLENRASNNDQPRVVVGDAIRVVQGEAQIKYDQGVTVVLAAPAVYEITGQNESRLIQGRLRGNVAESGHGFVVNTPRASVVDYGTKFGVNVENSGATDVVVFEGEVGVESNETKDSRLLKMGDGVRFDLHGTMSRLVAFDSRHFPSEDCSAPERRAPIITEVQDNMLRSDNLKYYEIVIGGMREDVRAYVDREFHQWNGFKETGIPPYLQGADFVRMFNDDKIDSRFELSVTVGQPAMLYVLYNNTEKHTPSWLRDGYEFTGDVIGLDVGPFVGWTRTYTEEDFTTGVGPGDSIDAMFQVWRKRIDKPSTLKLGENEQRNSRNSNMYAIAAVPLD
jgi:hypothetical protein